MIKTLIIIIATVMIFSSFGIAVGYTGFTSSASNAELPFSFSAGTHIGNVSIFANGTVSDTSVITRNGNSYALNSNLNGTLTDMSNNSVVTGNGFTVNGKGLSAVIIMNASSVTLTDFNLVNSTTGVFASGSGQFQVDHSSINATSYGVHVQYSSRLSLYKDDISSQNYGIYLYYSFGAVVSSTFVQASYGFYTPSSTDLLSFNNDTFLSTTDGITIAGDCNNNIILENSTVVGKGASSYGLNIRTYVANNVTVSNNEFTNISRYAIYDVINSGANYTISGNNFVNTSTSIYLCDLYNVLVTKNNYIKSSSYAIQGEYVVNVTVTNNSISNAPLADGIYFIYSDFVSISGNEITNVSDAIYLTCSTSISVFSNIISKASCGIYFDIPSANDINISGNVMTNITHDGIQICVESGNNFDINNNLVDHASSAIYVHCDIHNLTIENNKIYNPTTCGIFSQYSNNLLVSGNIVVGLNGSLNHWTAIRIEYTSRALVYDNVIEGNITHPASGGISICGSAYFSEFSNRVSNEQYAFKLCNSGNFFLFNNTASNSNYGIYSEHNFQFYYYSNNISMSNFSLESQYDQLGYIYGNTFSNAHHDMIYMYESSYLTFYHNNFLNGNRINVSLYKSPYNAWNLSLPVGGNYWSNYTGTGSQDIGSTPYVVNGAAKDYLPLTTEWSGYTVTFVESGLPSGTSWSVLLGNTSLSSDTQTLTFLPDAAQHISVDFSVQNVPGYQSKANTNSLVLDGTNLTVSVTFTAITYKATFTESGLSSGSAWTVKIGSQTVSSTTTSLGFSLANGTYNYTVGLVTGYHVASTSGSFQVVGSAESISLQYIQNTYVLTVTETGLPSGNSWSVNVSGKLTSTTGNSVQLTVVSGTYNVTVTGPSNFKVTLSTSSVNVNNANASLTAVFSNTSKAVSSGSVYEGLGMGAVVGAVVGVLGYMAYTGTWIFRKIKKGEGGSN